MTENEILNRIKEIAAGHNPLSMILFGSRARGCPLPGSDFDIAISGADDFDTLKEEIEDIPTLYSFDIVNLDTCKNAALLQEILKHGQKIL